MSTKIKNILKSIGIAIIICLLFGYFLLIIDTPIKNAEEICILNHNGDTLYFNNSGNMKYNRYSDHLIYIEDNSNKYKFINTIVKIKNT